MDKESIYELQKIDCNCNDCRYLFRFLEKQNIVLVEDKSQQQSMFYSVKERKINECIEDIERLKEHADIIKNVDKKIEGKSAYLKELQEKVYHYQGQRSPIQYGVCCKFQKQVTFLPNTCQLETQKCFEHRKS